MPRFSIITPVFNPPKQAFEQCVSSVMQQSFTDWEWCLADDASTEPWVSERLNDLQASDARVKVVNRATNGGIVRASNDAIALAGGEFLVLLDNDDELRHDALALVAEAADRSPEVDYLYSDENKLSPEGQHFDAFAKPVWSPERLLGQNYTSHLSVLRRDVVEAVGRFRPGFDGSQDYDLVLRVVERARNIVHIPHVLYHWRALPSSTASAAAAKPYAFVAALRAVTEHLRRRGIDAEVGEAGPSLARIRRTLPHRPRVTVIVPIDESRSQILGVDTWCAENVVRSLALRTTYTNHDVTFVAPQSVDEMALTTLSDRLSVPSRVVRVANGTPKADALNAGLAACSSLRAVVVDQHCEIVDDDWLQTLLSYEQLDGVAMVGATVVDLDGKIVSAGLSLSPEPHEIGLGRHADDVGPVGMLGIARECTGVSTRFALVDVPSLRKVGGISTDYQSRMADFDLACKLREEGLHSIVTPLARVRTFESRTNDDSELDVLRQRWPWLIGNDLYVRIDTRADAPSRPA